MEKPEIAERIKRIIRGELDDCERAIKAGNPKQALSELDDAVTKLRSLARELE